MKLVRDTNSEPGLPVDKLKPPASHAIEFDVNLCVKFSKYVVRPCLIRDMDPKRRVLHFKKQKEI